MTIKKGLLKTIQSFKKISSEPGLDAEVLLSFVLNKPKVWLYTHPEEKLTESEKKKFKALVRQRLKGAPIAYLIGHKEFFGLDFFVDKNVLIPEPETELLVEEVLKLDRKQAWTIADIGTGSGNIAITLAKYLPRTKIYATDISKNALEIAKRNAQKHRVEKQITFLQGNLLEPLPKKVDIICANLPYIPTPVAKKLKARPLISINGGKQGLLYFDSLLKEAPKYLKNNGRIFLEIDARQTKKIKRMVKKYLPKAKLKVKKDLANLDRLIILLLR